MKQLLHILKYKIISNARLDVKLNIGNLTKELGSILVYSFFAVGAYFFSETVLTILIDQLHIGLFLLHQFLSIVFFIFFLSVNVGNIIVSWSTLYKSQEINFYFTKPVAPGKVFLIKFIDNIFYSSSTLLLILIAVFIGYVSYFNLSVVSFFVILALNIIPFILTSAALGIIILLVLVKLASRIGARKLILSLAIIYLASIIFYFDMLSPLKLVYSVLAYYPNVDQYFGYFIPGIMNYMPHQWLAESLYWLVNDNMNNLTVNTIKQISTSVFFILAAMHLGKKWYYETWLMNIRFTNKNLSGNNFFSKISIRLFANYAKNMSIVIKDTILFLRESTQVLHALLLLFLVIIFMVSSAGISYKDFEQKNMAGIIYLAIFMFNILLISTLSLRFVFPLISLEGFAFWKIRTAPIKITTIINVKLLPFFTVIIAASILLTVFTHLQLAPHLILLSTVTSVSIAYFNVMINFGMGIIFVKYQEKNAIRIASSKGASLTFLFSLIYMVIVVAIMYTSIQEHFSVAINSGYISYHKISISFYLVFMLSFIAGTLFYIAAVKSIRKDY